MALLCNVESWFGFSFFRDGRQPSASWEAGLHVCLCVHGGCVLLQLRAEAPGFPLPAFPAKQRVATVFMTVSLEERRSKLESFLQECTELERLRGLTLASFLDPVLDKQLRGAFPVRCQCFACVRCMVWEKSHLVVVLDAITDVGCAICSSKR